MRLRRRSTTDAYDVAREDIESSDETRRGDGLAGMDDTKAKAFFRRNATEVIQRMRQPSDPANNIAAHVVVKFALDPRLRAEARSALENARITSEAKTALDHALKQCTLSNPPSRSMPKP